MAELEEVSGDEVAELERLAEQATQAAAAEKATLQPPDRRPFVKDEAAARDGAAMRIPKMPPEPPPPLHAFVDVATVEAHLAALDAKLLLLERQNRHAMLLVMCLAERFQITIADYDAAVQQVDAMEARRTKGQG